MNTVARLISAAGSLVVLVSTAACADPASNGRDAKQPAEYLVTIAPGAQLRAISEAYGQWGIQSIRGVGSNVFLITLSDDPGVSALQRLQGSHPDIKAVQPNFRYRVPK